MKGSNKPAMPLPRADAHRHRRTTDGRPRPVATAILRIESMGLALEPVPQGGKTVLARMAAVLRGVPWIQRILLLLPAGSDAVAAEAERLQLQVVRTERPIGPSDILRQLNQALHSVGATSDIPLVLVSSECPLLCSEVVSSAMEVLNEGLHDVVCADLGSGVLPQGLDVQALRYETIVRFDSLIAPQKRHEPWLSILRNPPFRCRMHELSPVELGPALERSGRYYASFQIGLLRPADLPLVQAVAAVLDRHSEGQSLNTLLRLLDQHPEWRNTQAPVWLAKAQH